MVVATGTGRCGTMTFAKIFGIPHEYRARQPGSLLGLHGRHLAADGHPFPELEDRVAIVRRHFDSFEMPYPQISESCGAYVGLLDAVYAIEPRAKVVLLTRHVHGFSRSLVNRGAYNRRDWISHPLADDPWYDRWAALAPVERAAWIWAWRS